VWNEFLVSNLFHGQGFDFLLSAHIFLCEIYFTFLAAALASVSLELVLDLEFEFCGWEL